MKIAGRKNDGAWYRANRMIRDLDSGEKMALSGILASLEGASNYLAVVQDFYLAAGLTGSDEYPHSVTDLSDNWANHGIPRQTWMGTLSYDTYTRSGEPGDYTYTPNHQATAFEFGKELRKAMRDFTFAKRQAKDLTNVAPKDEGNPGGIADATAGN